MHLASYVISLCLHAALFLALWFWPSSPPIRLDSPPIMISLVDGDAGGNRTPSPILGHIGEPADGVKAPTPPAPQSEIAAPARVETPPKPQSLPEKAIESKKLPEPKSEALPIARKKPEEAKPSPPKLPEEPKKEEPKKAKLEAKEPEPKPAEKPKAQPPKKEPEKKESPRPKLDPIQAALDQARKASSRATSGDRGNAIEQALAQAQRRAGGSGGGGGGEGAGPGGGGLGDVYMGQVMLAVRPNWGFASSARKSLVCVVKVLVDLQGKVQDARISQSSGNSQYDASAVNAVIRTDQAGNFPPPPSPDYSELDLVFSFDELMGR